MFENTYVSCSGIQLFENTNVRHIKGSKIHLLRKMFEFYVISNRMVGIERRKVDLSVNVSCNNLYSCTYLFIEDVNTSSLYLIKIKFEHFTKPLYFRTFSCGTILFSNNFY